MAAPSLAYRLDVAIQESTFPGAPLAEDPASKVALSGTYTSGSGGDRYALTGSGSASLDFSAIPAAGAKLVQIIYESGTAPITVTVDGGEVELTAGGVFLVANPSATAGISALSIAHTADAVVRVKVLG